MASLPAPPIQRHRHDHRRQRGHLTEVAEQNGDFSFTLPSVQQPTQFDLQASETSEAGIVGNSAPLSVLLEPSTLTAPTLTLYRDTGGNKSPATTS